jgi:hypothetical protein
MIVDVISDAELGRILRVYGDQPQRAANAMIELIAQLESGERLDLLSLKELEPSNIDSVKMAIAPNDIGLTSSDEMNYSWELRAESWATVRGLLVPFTSYLAPAGSQWLGGRRSSVPGDETGRGLNVLFSSSKANGW